MTRTRSILSAHADQVARNMIRDSAEYRAASEDSAVLIEMEMSRLVFAISAGIDAGSLVSATLNQEV
jgi:hypothetical protein